MVGKFIVSQTLNGRTIKISEELEIGTYVELALWQVEHD